MSHRPVTAKKIAKLRRSIQKNGGALPVYIDLIDWLKTRGHAQTTGEAKKIILARRVKSESHALGIKREPMLVKNKVELVDTVDPYVPATLRETLHVVAE